MLKNTAIVSLLTLLSRIFGYVRDVIIAAKLGAGLYNDIFIIALRIPNLFRTIFGEGAFNASFVPLYSKIMSQDGKNKADKFASNVQILLLTSVTAFSILLFIFMPQFVKLTLPGFRDDIRIILLVELCRITMPYLILISGVAFYGGILNSLGNFIPFAAAPVLLNIILIIFAFAGEDNLEDKVRYLSYGVTIGGIVELVWMLFFIFRANVKLHIVKVKVTNELKTFGRRIVPGIIGSGVAQINILVDTIIASFVANGISYLYYADRIIQLPLALVATSIGVVMLPSLSKAFGAKNTERAIRIHNNALSLLLYIALPATLGIIMLHSEIILAIFQHGAFDIEATHATSKALVYFATALPAYMMIKVFVANFHANGDTKTPVKLAAICIILNACIGFALLTTWQHVGIALASSISAWFNITAQWYILHKRGWFKISPTFTVLFRKCCIATLLMFIVILLLKNFISGNLLLILSIIVGGAIYLISLHLMRAIDWKELLKAAN